MRKNIPLYQQIEDTFMQQIQSGMLKTGDRLPSESEIVSTFHVSQITAKNALNNLAEQGVAERVQGKGTFVTAAEVPHRSPLIGIIFTTLKTSIDKELLDQLERFSQKNNIRFLFGLSRESIGEEVRLIDSFVNSSVEGLIIFPTESEIFNERIVKLQLDHFPLILIDRYFSKMNIPSVCSDNYEGGFKLAHYALEHKHKRLCFMTTQEENTATIDRQRGIEAAFTAQGLPIDKSLWLAVPSESDDQKTIMTFLNTHQPECVISVNAHVSDMVSPYTRTHKIPHLSFDNPLDCDYYVKQSPEGIADMAIHLLKESMLGNTIDSKALTVPVSIEKGVFREL